MNDKEPVVNHQDAIYVFANENGSITIKMAAYPEEDQLITFSIDNAELIIHAIRTAVNDLLEGE